MTKRHSYAQAFYRDVFLLGAAGAYNRSIRPMQLAFGVANVNLFVGETNNVIISGWINIF